MARKFPDRLHCELLYPYTLLYCTIQLYYPRSDDRAARCYKYDHDVESASIYTSQTGYPLSRQSTTHARGGAAVTSAGGLSARETSERWCRSRVQLSPRRGAAGGGPPRGKVGARPRGSGSTGGGGGGGGGGGERRPPSVRSLNDRLEPDGAAAARDAGRPGSASPMRRRPAGWSVAAAPAARRGNVRPPPKQVPEVKDTGRRASLPVWPAGPLSV